MENNIDARDKLAEGAKIIAKKWATQVKDGKLEFSFLPRQIFYSSLENGCLASVKAMLQLVALDPDDDEDIETMQAYKEELILHGGLRDMVHVLRDGGYNNSSSRCIDPRSDIITLIQVLCEGDLRVFQFLKAFRGVTAIKQIAETKGLYYPLTCTAWNAMAQFTNTGPHAEQANVPKAYSTCP